jgi:membrane-associated phospholipid phosphatase
MAVTGRRGATATDRLMLAFLAANTLIVLWRACAAELTPAQTGWLLLANALTALLIGLLARSSGTGWLRLVGGAYPVMLTVAYFTQLDVLNLGHALVHDWRVQQWEVALFGSQVSTTWQRSMPNALLSWVLHTCYGSYYAFLVGVPLYLFLRGTPDAYERGGFGFALTFYLSYLAFALWPVAGPRYFFGPATGPATLVPPARVVHAILAGGSSWGTAFPSSHIAVSWVATLVVWRDHRRAFWLLAPVAFGLALGTVYGQFHYAVDAVAGAAVGLLLFFLLDPLRRLLSPQRP